jgi:adenine-specific DNA-methyltransferase
MKAKRLGAYYTDRQIADFLVSWAIRVPTDSALDPSFGGGVFLEAAATRISEVGGCVDSQLHGVELDAEVHASVASLMGAQNPNLIQSDFFALPPGSLMVDAIIGNPPFIRFHHFSGEVRRRALLRSRQSGVNLSGLSSSWAPFLVHAASMIREGGRLAMVVPTEISYATYAVPVLAKLASCFGAIRLLSFRKKLFPNLSESTMLLLADVYGGNCSEISVYDLEDARELAGLDFQATSQRHPANLSTASILSGEMRFAEIYLDRTARGLYKSLAESPCVLKLGDAADVGIGYVTGANSFFHFSGSSPEELGIPARCLSRSVLKGKALKGVSFSDDDWDSGRVAGDTGYLLSISQPASTLPSPVRDYLSDGEKSGSSAGYKCRNRSPWYAVPKGELPDGFLTYMSGSRPRLVANDTNAYAPNTLHVVKVKPAAMTSITSLAAGWQTSLSELSAELEGHALGGGMLKIEPGEARQLLVPANGWDASGLLSELDRLVRQGRQAEATALADEEILVKRIGVSGTDCRALQRAACVLKERRGQKGTVA